MDYSFEFRGQRVVFDPPRLLRSKLNLTLLVLASGLVLAVVSAFLVVRGDWYLAMGMILAVPGLILLHKYPLLGLVLWLFITPFLMASDSGLYRKLYWLIHRGLPLLMLALIASGTMMGLHKRKIPKPAWFEIVMLAYAIITMISAIVMNPEPTQTAYRVYDRIVVPMLLYLIIRLLSPDENDLRRMLPVILFLGLSQAFFGLAYIGFRGILPGSWLRTDGERATGSMRAVAVYSTTLLFAGTILLHTALSGKVKPGLRLLFIGIFAACMIAVFFSFSRASWLASVAVMAGLFLIYPRFITRFALLALPVVAIGAGVLLADQLAYADRRLNSEQSALGRLPVILASIEMFKARPVFGFGYGNFDEYDRQFQGRVGDLVAPEKDHASHNLFLTVLAEQGIVGLAMYVAPLVGLVHLSIRKWRLLPAEGFWSRKLLIIFWLTIIAHIVVNQFSNMRIVFGLGIWWITLALIANLLAQAPEPERETKLPEAYWRAG